MTKRSTMLKVVAIIMIVLAAISTLTVLAAHAAVVAMGLDYALSLAGIDPALYNMSIVLSVVTCVFELVVGIIGLAAKSVKLIFILGIVLIILAVIGLIFSFQTASAGWSSITSFILPILYVIGAKQCVQ